jgi:hypothetical protein
MSLESSLNACAAFQYSRDPTEQSCPDFAAVNLIEHFVSSTGVEIVGDAIDARFAIAEMLVPG